MPKPRALSRKPEPSTLLTALKFLKAAVLEKGLPHQTHFSFFNNRAVAFNGVVSAGCTITEDIFTFPHAHSLIDALERCGEPFTITQLENGKLAVKGELFKAFVPCMRPEEMQTVMPDDPVAPINDNLLKALSVVSPLASDASDRVVTASILMQPGSVISTNSHVMFEAWHGLDLPTMVLPKAAATALLKSGKSLQSIGCSLVSVTFWFTDGSFIKTLVYPEAWPNVDRILNVETHAWPVPKNLFEALHAIEPFCDDGVVVFKQGRVCTHVDEGVGAEYQVQGIPRDVCFDIDYLLMIEKIATQIDFGSVEGKAHFFGDNLRGVICAMITPKKHEPYVDTRTPEEIEAARTTEEAKRQAWIAEHGNNDDYIPF